MESHQHIALVLNGSWVAENQKVLLDPKRYHGCTLYIKREDLIDPVVSGNKYRKLRYNLKAARSAKRHTLFTFGGAYSNHLAAVARAARLMGLRSIGIVRGNELNRNSNSTLEFCSREGMELFFLDRETYRNRDDQKLLEEYAPYPNETYLLPEGGTNELAVKGCEEILAPQDNAFDYICTAVGTGGTLAGILRSSGVHQKVIGFSALKGSFLQTEVEKYSKKPFILTDRYCRGGYGKIDAQLVRFINSFQKKSGILLDPVYTSKMIFGVLDMIETGQIPAGSAILAIHTGGLQAINGSNKYLKEKNLPQIEQ